MRCVAATHALSLLAGHSLLFVVVVQHTALTRMDTMPTHVPQPSMIDPSTTHMHPGGDQIKPHQPPKPLPPSRDTQPCSPHCWRLASPSPTPTPTASPLPTQNTNAAAALLAVPRRRSTASPTTGPRSSSAAWSPLEDGLLRKAHTLFQGDCCRLAPLVAGRRCWQVHRRIAEVRRVGCVCVCVRKAALLPSSGSVDALAPGCNLLCRCFVSHGWLASIHAFQSACPVHAFRGGHHSIAAMQPPHEKNVCTAPLAPPPHHVNHLSFLCMHSLASPLAAALGRHSQSPSPSAASAKRCV